MDFLSPLAPLISALISAGIGCYVGRTGQRRGELEAHLKEFEERVWQFAQSSEEYWNLDPDDDRLRGLEIAMKNLSARMGSDIARLNSNYRGFHFNNSAYLTALRQTAMSSPFEEKGRQPDLQRGDRIRRASRELIGAMRRARTGLWKRLLGHRCFRFLKRSRDVDQLPADP